MQKIHSTKKRSRPAMVNILGCLLILQAVELFLLGVYHFNMSQGPQLLNQFLSHWLSGEIPADLASLRLFIHQLVQNSASRSLAIALVESAALFLLTTLALWAAVGFFRLWEIGWMQAMFVQGATLLIALILFLYSRPSHTYLLMGTGVFMVLYLNFSDLQAVFHLAAEPASLQEEV
jgi:hypothetical protein